MTAIPQQALPVAHDIARTLQVLGGSSTIRQPVHTSLEAHDLLAQGLPAKVLERLESAVSFHGDISVSFQKALGVSTRTMQRHKAAGKDSLPSPEQSSRASRFAEILGRAMAIFGSQAEGLTWMTQPAIGLDQRKPIDLLATHVEAEVVEEYLSRIEYGVYT